MYTMNYIITAKQYRHMYYYSNHMTLHKATSVYYEWVSTSQNYLCKLNDHYVTYIIGPNINNHLSISIIHLISPWNIKLFNYSLARMVVIGRPMHKITSIASSRIQYKIYVRTRTIYAWNSRPSLPVNQPNGKPHTPSTLVHCYHCMAIG